MATKFLTRLLIGVIFYIYGENTASTTGGANTHTHTITGTTGGGTGGSYRDRGTAPQVSAADDAHTHTVSSNTGSVSGEPPYIQVILGKLSTSSAPVNGMITMWTDQVGTGWDDVSSDATDPFRGKFLKASTTYGGTGGASTSTHANGANVRSLSPLLLNGCPHPRLRTLRLNPAGRFVGSMCLGLPSRGKTRPGI